MKALIIGRTNVGKSSLFNRIAKKRKALVFDESGITRDILKEPVDWWGHDFEIMDSGGLPKQEEKDELNLKIQEHIESAMKIADIFIVVTDGRVGIHSDDTRMIEMVRRTGKPFVLFVNKIDSPKDTNILTAEFFSLSNNILSGSVEQNFGVDEVIEWIISYKKEENIKLSKKRDAKLKKKTQKLKLEEELKLKKAEENAKLKLETATQIKTDAKLETESETEARLATDTEAKTATQIKTDAKLETESETEARLAADTETETATQIKTDAKLETESETEARLAADAETKTATQIKTDAKLETESETEARLAADAETELKAEENAEKNKLTSLFVIGKANSGKSLLCNQILSTERMIVSAKAGTTLDTVTEYFSKDTEEYSISDNPGSRRGKREEREKLSFSKSLSEIYKSHIVLIVIDGMVGPSRQDARLVQLCLEKRKPVILVVNKMDLVRKLDEEVRKQKKEDLKKIFHFCSDLPIVFISAKTAYHKEKLFNVIDNIKVKMNLKISTSQLNNFFTQTIRKAPSPVYGTSNVKFYYITQTHKTPPDFIAFANYPKGVTPSYRRFVINQIKENWDLKGIPIGLNILQKS